VRVINTSSEDENLAKVKMPLKSDKVEGINYRAKPAGRPNFSGGQGTDITIDATGGNGISQAVDATKVQSVNAQVGFLTGQKRLSF